MAVFRRARRLSFTINLCLVSPIAPNVLALARPAKLAFEGAKNSSDRAGAGGTSITPSRRAPRLALSLCLCFDIAEKRLSLERLGKEVALKFLRSHFL